jgi:DNA-binding transcriptional ArsR family regulator
MSIVNGLVAAGEPDSSIRTLLLDEGNEGARHFNFDSKGRPRPTSTRERFVRDAIRKARARQAQHRCLRDRYEVTVAVARIRDAVDAVPGRWSGRAGSVDRAIVMGVIGVALRIPKLELSVAVRQAADAAGVEVGTAARALRRLAERGDFLRLVEPGVGRRAATYRLVERPETEQSSVPERTEPVCVDECLNHDAWTERGGLGKTKGRIHGLLGTEPIRTDELARLLGVAPRSVRAHLTVLRRFDLANWKGRDVGWIRGPASLDEVARALGVAGRGVDRQTRHAADRAAWHKRYETERKEAQVPSAFAEAVGLMSVPRARIGISVPRAAAEGRT